MSNFSTNFQFNIAQMNSLTHEQEKNRNVGKKQQEGTAKKIENDRDASHISVNATEEGRNPKVVHDEEEKGQEQKSDEKEQSLQDRTQPHTSEKPVIYKDDEKGKIIDFSG